MSSPRQFRGRSLRIVGAAGVAAIAAMTYSSAAVADVAPDLSTVTGTVQSVPGQATAVPSHVTAVPGTVGSIVAEGPGGATQKLPTQMLAAEQDGQTVQGFSLDPAQKLENGQLPLANATSAANLPKGALERIQWIVKNAAIADANPGDVTSLVQSLAGKANLPVGEALTPQQAVAATQAAVWHFSDGTKLASAGNPPAVADLYNYLTSKANVGAPVQEMSALDLPETGAPSVTDLPAALKDKVGGDTTRLLGPVKAPDAAKDVNVNLANPASGQLLDEAGNKVTELQAGKDYFVALPKGADKGKVLLEAVGGPQEAVGQVLATVTSGQVNPAMVVTGGTLPVKQAAQVSYDNQANGGEGGSSLPVTGAQAGLFAGVGALLIGGGAALYIVTRRRRSAASEGSAKA